MVLFAISVVIYGYEIVIGLQLFSNSTDTGALTALFEVLLGAYAIGLRRAWELLGAPFRSGALSTALETFLGRWRNRAPGAKGAPERDDGAERPNVH